MSQPDEFDLGLAKPKGILKKAHENDIPANSTRLRWDEDNLKITEAQKDAKMKVDEPKTPFIRYNPDDADMDEMDEMEDLKLTSGVSSRSSSVASSPKRAQVVAPLDWVSENEDEGETEVDRAKHERFRKLRERHYHQEGRYVHDDNPDIEDSDNPAVSDDAGSSDSDAAMGALDSLRRNGSGRPAGRGARPTAGVDEANASEMEI
ncbi:hypothetical protein IWQ57_002179 [Coemansia nantahalensis]|uniref:Uncharacterized protein n=2 Tax=Coemansia TaxID=4863 RepID=A0ACC1KX73_9FUNG|nr:hypothetical protein IWQ57_002179 [Coemansia nantahalensis]KAJ2796744.1 hypothetical protein H4R21_004590 [Coemansia helicoidea]